MQSEIKATLRKSHLVTNVYTKLRTLYFKYFLTDLTLIRRKFKKRTGRNVEFKAPTKYNDKLQWLKLYWKDPLAATCADKYEVRKTVKDLIGNKYLNEIYGVYESVDQININNLPDSFVLKGTHGSGFNIICEDKSKLNWKSEFQTMKRWLNYNYYWQNREWVYKGLKPRIISEKFLSDARGIPPMDYKIFCFHGEPKIIQVDIDRFGGHKQNFYDTEWNFRDVEIWCDNDKSIELTKPVNFNEMLEVSRKLSKPFPHVRVDLYNLDGQIIFGELTFFHLSGMQKFRNEALEKEMGKWLRLEQIDENGLYKG